MITREKLISLFFLLFIGLVSSQITAQQDRPKIGVALSGGGAKGMAHVGFLQALHEAGVRPDFITGVSMGSIVGGMYASGYHPDVLAQEFRKQDYELLLSDNIDENMVFFDEKPFFRNRLLSFTYKKSGDFVTSGGLIQGQYFTSMLNYYLWPVNTVRDFSELPVPFKSIATNVQTVAPKVFDSGNLVEVVRASMSVPLAFSPVEIDDSLYLDGGIRRNFAVSELKDMGADILIGSYTGGEIIEKEKLNSVPSITTQLLGYQGVKSSVEQSTELDLIVSYKFGDLNGTSFASYDSLINLGYNTALKHNEEFKQIAELQGNPPEKRRRVPEFKSIVIDSILIEGNIFLSDELIIQYLGLKAGYKITPQLMKKKITYMYGLFLFDKIYYEIRKRGANNQLIIKCVEKPRNWMNMSIYYDTHYDFGVNFDFIFRKALFNNGRLSVNAFFSKFYRLKTRYNLYYGNQNKWVTSLGLKMSRDNIPAFKNGSNFIQLTFLDLNADLSLGYHFNINTRLGLDMEYEFISQSPVIKQIDFWERSKIENFNFKLIFERNNLDKYYFPTKGSEVKLELKSINLRSASHVYSDPVLNPEVLYEPTLLSNASISWRSRFYRKIGERVVLGGRFNGFFSFGEREVDNDWMLLGGYDSRSSRTLPFVGFFTNEFLLKNGIGGGTSVMFFINKTLSISVKADTYFLQSAEMDRYKLFAGSGLELGYRSRIGPLKAGASYGFYSEREIFSPLKLYFSIGYLLE